MQRNVAKRLGVLAAAGAIAACLSSANPKLSSHNEGPMREVNEGYSLLHQLMSDETDVSKILILKHADDPVANAVKEIAHACQAAKTRMDDFPKTDVRIEFDVPDLPRVEQESRDLDSSIEEKELLFSSGKTFELRLIYSQAQAMEYGEVLCKALAAREDDAGRKAFVTDLSKQCADFRDRLLGLLAVKS
jgi:hypothetical protein